jgi:hypothetical protein
VGSVKGLFFLFTLLYLSGCASKPVATQTFVSAKAPIAQSKERIFPDGTYHHRVSVKAENEKAEAQSFQIDGVVELNKDKILIRGLSPMFTTLFELEENVATGELRFETFVTAFEKHREKIFKVYEQLRVMLVATDHLVSGNLVVRVVYDEKGRLKLFESAVSE